MDEDIKDLLLLLLRWIGNGFLFIPMSIAFLDWTFSMMYFRTMIFGLVLIVIAGYLKDTK